MPVFVASLWCGSVVLTWLWLRSGGSTLLAILWHGSYDLLAGSAASAGAAGLAVSVLIDTAGVCLAVAELRLRRRGRTLIPAVDGASVRAPGRETGPRSCERLTLGRGGLVLWRSDSREKLLVTVDQRRVERERRERLGGHRPPCSRTTAVQAALTS